MRINGSEQQLCSCYKKYQDFQKLVELEDSSVVVYHHRTRTEDVRHQRWESEVDEQAENTTADVFVLHNKKNMRITTSQLTSELEKKNISCPRCRKIFKHAQDLMQEVKLIERNTVIGICDHCRKKAQMVKNEFCVCDEIVRKFKSGKREHKENTKKHAKTWLSKIEHDLKDTITLNKPKQIKHRAYSDLQINRDLKSSTSRDGLAIQQLFSHKSDLNLNREMRETNLEEHYFKPGVTFSQPLFSIKPVATSFADTLNDRENINTMISRSSLLETSEDVKELPITSLKDRRKEEIFENTPSIDTKDALKRRHDLSLRQMMRLEKDSGVLLNVSKRPMVYEIPKVAPWEQKEPTPKYHEESEKDIKTNHDLRPRGTRDQRKTDKYSDSKKSNKFGLKSKVLDPQVSKSKSLYEKNTKPKKTGPRPQFSFYFPKITEKKQVQLDVSSSHLIKYTQEKFRRQAEKKRQGEKRHQDFDHNQNRISRDEKEKEKKRQIEGKKRQAVEDEKKYDEDQELLHKYSKKDLGSSSGDEEKQQDKAKKDEEISFQLQGKISKESGIVKKDGKSDPEREHKLNEQRYKIDDDLLSKAMKIDRVKESEKIKKDLKMISDPKDKAGEKIQTIKIEEEQRDVKTRKEKEALEKRAAKETEILIKDIDAPSKHGKSTKIKRDSPSKIKVSLSKILETKISANEKKRTEIKQVKEIKIKTQDGDEKKRKEKEEGLGLIQMEQLQKEREPLKKQVEKEHLLKNRDAPPKTEKSTKIKQVSLGEINVSQTKILKGTKKDISTNEKEMIEIKQVKEAKTRTEEDEKMRKEEIKRLEQIKQLQKERKTLKKQAEKEQLLEHKDAPSTTGKSSKIKKVSPDEIKMSPSSNEKNIEEKKEISANKKDVLEIKQKILEKEDTKEKKEPSAKISKPNSEFLKLQAEHLKQKKKQLEYEAKEKERKLKEQAELMVKHVDIKMRDSKEEHLSKREQILNLVRLKQAASMKPSDVKPMVIEEHKCHHNINIRLFCPLCYNSELEMEVISLDNKKSVSPKSIKEMIIGEKIFKIKQLLEKSTEPEIVLNLYQNFFFEPPNELIPQEEPAKRRSKPIINKLSKDLSTTRTHYTDKLCPTPGITLVLRMRS